MRVLVLGGFAAAEEREVVILYTNDFHSAIDPIPAYWLDAEPTPHLGGAAELMTPVEQIREREARARIPVFLFDTGDMFTGMLSKLTEGEALIEMMITMGYDALGFGNHEFDYGWQLSGKKLGHIDKDLAQIVIERFKTQTTVGAPATERLIPVR